MAQQVNKLIWTAHRRIHRGEDEEKRRKKRREIGMEGGKEGCERREEALPSRHVSCSNTRAFTPVSLVIVSREPSTATVWWGFRRPTIHSTRCPASSSRVISSPFSPRPCTPADRCATGFCHVSPTLIPSYEAPWTIVSLTLYTCLLLDVEDISLFLSSFLSFFARSPQFVVW